MKQVRIYDSLEALAPAYEDMSGASAGASIFLTLPWFKNLHETVLSRSATIRIYSVESEDQAQTAFVMQHAGPGKPWLAPRKLHAAANYYTPFFGPVTIEPRTQAEQDLHLLAQAIAKDRPRWDTVDLHPLDAGAPTFQYTINAFRKAGMAAQSYFCFGNWYLDVAGRSYQEYFDGLPSKLRSTVQRKTRQLEASNRARIEIVTDESALDKAIAAFESVYRSSWKSPEPYPDFMPGLIATCARQGWLRLGLATIDDQPAAAQIWIVHNNVASIYKLAYDERFTKHSIGSILTARLMQHALDVDRVREVDYLNGDEPYKQEWMSHRRERRGIVAFNLRSVRGLLAALRHIGGRAIKNLLGIGK